VVQNLSELTATSEELGEVLAQTEGGAAMKTELPRFNDAVERDPDIDAWMKEHAGGLAAIAHQGRQVCRGARRARRIGRSFPSWRTRW
jgi:hypothetical protein